MMSFVGRASIEVFRGLYHHLALIVTYWMPSFTTTLSEATESILFDPVGHRMRKKNTITNTTTRTIVKIEAVSSDFLDII
jgi:hypothetical protein